MATINYSEKKLEAHLKVHFSMEHNGGQSIFEVRFKFLYQMFLYCITSFFLNDLFLYLAIDTAFHPSGIFQNGMEISSKFHV